MSRNDEKKMIKTLIRESSKSLHPEIAAGREEDRLTILTIEIEDLLNKDVKAYENNDKIVGLQYQIKEAQKRDDAGLTARRKFVVDALVKAKVITAAKVFHQSGPNKGKEIRRILRDAHPLRQVNNAAIVVAFTKSWFVGQIKGRVRGKGLELGAMKVHPHHPFIIDMLKNEALKERRRLLQKHDTGP
jgi:hypothetical protein